MDDKKQTYIDLGAALFFIALAAFIWLRDLHWASSSDDTLPILVALPLFVYLGSPWNLIKPGNLIKPNENVSLPIIKTFWIIVGVVFFTLGIGLNLTFLLTISFLALLWGYLSLRLPPEKLPSLKKLLFLPLLAFPWITLDGEKIGWYFRLSGAYATAKFYEFFGYDVKLEGTNILVNGLPISVEAACSGLNTLQSMLIAGITAAFLMLGNTNRFYWNILTIIAVAWLANTLRIISISFAALAVSSEFALGTFHTVGGWFILIIMFLLCLSIFALQEESKEKGELNE